MDKYMLRFIYSLLAFAAIIIPGPIVPLISLAIGIGILIYKLKAAKESREGFDILKIDVIWLIIVLVIDIAFFGLRISIESTYNRDNSSYKSSVEQEMTASEFAETVISLYRVKNSSLFYSEKNNSKTIRSGFKSYLQNDLEMNDVTIKGKNVICYYENEKIVFTVDDNEISFNIK